jgi:hypothetical protein
LSEYPPGREAPIPRAAVDAKFLSQSAPVLGAQRAQAALQTLRGIAEIKNVRPLGAVLAGA